MSNAIVAQNKIEFISGSNNILLVAPHGYLGDDDNTGKLTRLVAEQSGCYAIINEFYQKPENEVNQEEINSDADADADRRIDLNNLVQVKKHLQKEFLTPLIEISSKIRQNGIGVILWIHGAKDISVKNDVQKKDTVNPDEIKVLVGYGQKIGNDRYTAKPGTANELIATLTRYDLNAVAANPDKKVDTEKGIFSYCGHDKNNMNQIFRTYGYTVPNALSFQLEFRMKDCREPENLSSTAKKLADAISNFNENRIKPSIKLLQPIKNKSFKKKQTKANPLIDDVDDEKVEKAYEHIKGIFIKKFQETMLEIGQYLIEHFYDGNYDKAKSKPFTHNKSLKRLYEKLETETSGNLPKKSWLYNSINLAISENDFGKDSIYGKLGRSHKVLLAGQKKLDKTKKINLMERAVDGKWTVVRLQHEIKQEKSDKETPKIDIFNLPHKEVLMKQPPKILNRLKGKADVIIQTSTDTLKIAKLAEKRIKRAIETQEPSPAKLRKAIQNNEWTVARNNVNFQTGCSNACIYCYGRFMFNAERLKKEAEAQGKEFHWGEVSIRQNDVEANYGLKDGRVGFPSSHDITPENLADYLTVLGKLLRAGNKILIITKPVIECIQAICNASAFFKEDILFRFTITAKSSDVLKFWEPNAPSYEHRFECLKYAYAAGFNTSVSIEPMLEYPRAHEMVDEMLPYITDAIWFGKMNHIKSFDNPGDDLNVELEKVETGHSDDNIKALYEIYGDNPKIKWKLAYKDVLGIPLPPAPGMDI